MITMDAYASRSKLREVSPGAKAAYAVGTLLVCITVSSGALSAGIFCLMAVSCVAGSGLKAGTFIRLCALPLGFVLIGALTIALGLDAQPRGIAAVPLFGRYLVLTAAGGAQAAQLVLNSMAGVSCMYFLYVTTPVGELLGLLNRLHCPKLFTELTMMVYRFIFILLDMAEGIHISQTSRLGNAGFAVSLRSAGILGGSVFIKAFKRSGEILNAMESRGYTGDFDYTESLPAVGRREWLALAVYGLILGAAAVICRLAGV